MNDTFLKACRGESTDYTPIWMMRQAGRYLPEFQKILAQHGFLKMCRTPELAAEITIQPVDLIGVDAAIFFSDITTTVVPMGMALDYADGKGPFFSSPIRTSVDVDRLIVPEESDDGLDFVYDAQKICARELENKVPLIGFAGSPFTVAAYMVEGHGTQLFSNFRRMIFSDTTAFSTLMDKVSRHTTNYLNAQAAAGANALMLFDTLAGLLGPKDFQALNLPHIRKIIAGIKGSGVPIIYFGLGAHGSLDAIRQCGADVIGVDYGLQLDDAVKQLGTGVSVQGNIEPNVLFQARQDIEKRVIDTLERGKSARGHIFNLGHGVPLHAPVDGIKAMVDLVHEKSPAISA